MNVVFLDYDGVINTPMWEVRADGEWVCRFAMPRDNKVNNTQAVQWLSEFCQKYKYSIVVSSSWRNSSNYKECIINAGLRHGIEIIGKTPTIRSDDIDNERLGEIKSYLSLHPEVEAYIIIDDDMIDDPQFVKCDTCYGFMEPEFLAAESIHKAFFES